MKSNNCGVLIAIRSQISDGSAQQRSLQSSAQDAIHPAALKAPVLATDIAPQASTGQRRSVRLNFRPQQIGAVAFHEKQQQTNVDCLLFAFLLTNHN